MSKRAVETTTKRVALNMKTIPEVRARLEAAAAASGRSLTAEVEARIEASFAHDGIAARLDRIEALLASLAQTSETRLSLDGITSSLVDQNFASTAEKLAAFARKG